MHSTSGIEPTNPDGAIHAKNEDVRDVMSTSPAIVEDGLDFIILSRLDVEVEAIESIPNLWKRRVLCHGSLLEGKYLFLQQHLDSGKKMLMEDIDDDPRPKSEPQSKTAMAQPKVELQRKKVAP